jgi:hypothetical protein
MDNEQPNNDAAINSESNNIDNSTDNNENDTSYLNTRKGKISSFAPSTVNNVWGFQRSVDNFVQSTQDPQGDPYYSYRLVSAQVRAFEEQTQKQGMTGSRFSSSTIMQQIMGDYTNEVANSSAIRGGLANRFIMSAAVRDEQIKSTLANIKNRNSFGPLSINEEVYNEWVADAAKDANNPAIQGETKAILLQGTDGYTLVTPSRFNAIESRDQKIRNVTQPPREVLIVPDNNILGAGQQTMHASMSGFVPRADVNDYVALIDSSPSLKAVFFQFQNTDITSHLIAGNTRYNILTQRYDADPVMSDDVGHQILAPNEFSIAVQEQVKHMLGRDGGMPGTALGIQMMARNADNESYQAWHQAKIESDIQGVYHIGSFHPKVGYTDSTAFIGTQNITGPLNKQSTIESLLVVDKHGVKAEQSLYSQLRLYTDIAHTLAADKAKAARESGRKEYIKPGELVSRYETARNEQLGNHHKYLYLDNEIFDRYKSVIDRAANSSPNKTDKVMISMGEISLLLKSDIRSQDVMDFKANLLVLAKERRLHLVTDSERLTKFLDGNGTDLNFIAELTKYGALTTSTTGMMHDKSVAIFDDNNKLKFLSTGSANWSDMALLQIDDLAVETKSKIEEKLKRAGINKGTEADIGKQTVNSELIMAMGIGEYREQSVLRGQKEYDAEVSEYLNKLTASKREVLAPQWRDNDQSGTIDLIPRLIADKNASTGEYVFDPNNPLTTHFYTQAGLRNNEGTKLFSGGYKSERASMYGAERVHVANRIKQLKETLSKINHLEVAYRYAPENNINLTENRLNPVGLRVTIYGLKESDHRLTLDLAVTKEDTVIISDLNKVINQSQFVNQTSKPIEIKTMIGTEPKKVGVGDSIRLDAFETTIGLLQTIQREFTVQQEHGLVRHVFEDMALQNPQKLIEVIKNFTADKIAEIFPEQAVDNSDRATNLETFLHEFSEGNNRQKFIQGLGLIKTAIIENNVGTSNTPANVEKRRILLDNIIDQTLGTDTLVDEPHTINVYTKRMASMLLSDTEGIFDDLKRELISRDDVANLKFKSAAKTQSRNIPTELLAPFLAAHEETYGNYQGLSRLPVYGESTNFSIISGDSTYERTIQAGLLNPLAMTHGTRIGKAGEFYRALASTSFGKKLQLSGYGELRQLNIIDSDISTGASAVHAMETLAKTTPGFNYITYDQHVKTLAKYLGRDLTEEEKTEIQTNFGLKQTILYALPFDKLEQMTQRIKNVVGSRPALSVSQQFVARVLKTLNVSKDVYRKKNVVLSNDELAGLEKLSHTSRLKADDIMSGELRSVLPQEQFNRVAEVVEIIKTKHGRPENNPVTYEEIRTYFREEQINPFSIQRGFIGQESYKRVALHGGYSLLGDYSYYNAQYQEYVGQNHLIRTKINPNQVTNIQQFKQDLGQVLNIGTIITSVDLPQADGTTLARGMYVEKVVDGKSQLVKVGSYDDQGFIVLDIVNKILDSPTGRRLQGIKFKSPANSKKQQMGITIITSTPNLELTGRQTFVYEADSMTIYDPTTGSRVIGSGLYKSPMLFLQEKGTFDIINKSIEARNQLGESYSDFTPESMKNRQIYGLSSMNVFKGYSADVGLHILSDENVRAKIKALSGKEIARSLAILFLGDKGEAGQENIKQALVTSLESEGLYQAAASIDGVKAKSDISKTNRETSSNLGILAAGLATLTEDANVAKALSTGDLSYVKETVRQALLGNEQAIRTLETKSRTLITKAEEGAHRFTTEGGKSFTQFSEGDVINRGAGMLTHMIFLNRQLFASSSNTNTVKGLYESRIDDFLLYTGEVKEREGFTSESYRRYVDFVLRESGVKVDKFDLDNKEKYQEFKTHVSFVQAMLDNAFIIENFVDATVSQSLVPAGMQDTIKAEYQYLLGQSAAQLKAYEKVGGMTSESVQIQQAFTILMGATSTNIITGMNAGVVNYKLVFPGDEVGLMSPLSMNLKQAASLYTKKGDKAFPSLVRNIIDTDGSYSLDPNSQNRLNTSSFYAVVNAKENDVSFDGTDYVKGLKKIRDTILGMKDNEAYIPILQDITKTHQVVLPHLDYKLDPNTGLFTASIRDPKKYTPTVGVILGLDVLENIATTFGEHKDEILTSQMALIESLMYTNKILKKVWGESKGGQNVQLTEFEVIKLQRLQQAAEISRIAPIKAATTDIARQAMGDHLKFTGGTGIAVNSFILNPDEFLAGERFARIAETRQMTKAIKTLSHMLITETDSADAYKNIDTMQSLLRSTVGYMGNDDLSKVSDKTRASLQQVLARQTEREVATKDMLIELREFSQIKSLGFDSLSTDAQLRYKSYVAELEAVKSTKILFEEYTAGKYETLDSKFTASQLEFYNKIHSEGIDVALANHMEHARASELKEINRRHIDENKIPILSDQAREKIAQARLYASYLVNDSENVTHDLDRWKHILLEMALNDKKSKTNTIEMKLALAGGGRVTRSGAPSSSAAAVNNALFGRGIALESYNKRRKALNPDLTADTIQLFVDADKFSTGMVTPSLGRLLSMLGDNDGDSYQLMLSTGGDYAAKLESAHKRLIRLVTLKEEQPKVTEILSTKNIDENITKTLLYLEFKLKPPKENSLSINETLENIIVRLDDNINSLKNTSVRQGYLVRTESNLAEGTYDHIAAQKYGSIKVGDTQKVGFIKVADFYANVGSGLTDGDIGKTFVSYVPDAMQRPTIAEINALDKAVYGKGGVGFNSVITLMEQASLALASNTSEEAELLKAELLKHIDLAKGREHGKKKMTTITHEAARLWKKTINILGADTAGLTEALVRENFVEVNGQVINKDMLQMKRLTTLYKMYVGDPAEVSTFINDIEKVSIMLQNQKANSSAAIEFSDRTLAKSIGRQEEYNTSKLREVRKQAQKLRSHPDVQYSKISEPLTESANTLINLISAREQAVIAYTNAAKDLVIKTPTLTSDTITYKQLTVPQAIEGELGLVRLDEKRRYSNLSVKQLKATRASLTAITESIQQNLAAESMMFLDTDSPAYIRENVLPVLQEQLNLSRRQLKLIDLDMGTSHFLDLNVKQLDLTEKISQLKSAIETQISDIENRRLNLSDTSPERISLASKLNDLQKINTDVMLAQRANIETLQSTRDIVETKLGALKSQYRGPALPENVENTIRVGESLISDTINIESQQIESYQRTKPTLDANITPHLEAISNLYNPMIIQGIADFNASITDQNSGLTALIDEAKTEYGKALTELEEHNKAINKLLAKGTDDIKKSLETYLGLPDYVTGESQRHAAMTDVDLSTILQQKFDTRQLGALEKHYEASKGMVDLLANKLIDTSPVTSALLTAAQTFKENRQNNRAALENINIQDLSTSLELPELATKGLLEHLAEVDHPRLMDIPTLQSQVKKYVTTNVNIQMSTESLSNTLEKGSGLLLNPFQYDPAISVIGQGGSTLIGEAYNTLIPLMDSLVMESSMLNVASMSYGTGDAEGLRALFNQYSLAHLLSDENKSSLQRRFEASNRLLENFQQIVRDALKAKDKGAFESFINDKVYEGTTLGEYLNLLPEEGITGVEDSKNKIRVLNNFLATKLGPNISDDAFLEPSTNLRDAITGFGAINLLADYTRTKDEDIYKKFIDPDSSTSDHYSLKTEFERWLGEQEAANKVKMAESPFDSSVLNQKFKRWLTTEFANQGNTNIQSIDTEVLQRKFEGWLNKEFEEQSRLRPTTFTGDIEVVKANFSTWVDTNLVSKINTAGRIGLESMPEINEKFQQWMMEQNIVPVDQKVNLGDNSPIELQKRFVAEKIVNLLERTQASFLGGSMRDGFNTLDVITRTVDHRLSLSTDDARLAPMTKSVDSYFSQFGISFEYDNSTLKAVYTPEAATIKGITNSFPEAARFTLSVLDTDPQSGTFDRMKLQVGSSDLGQFDSMLKTVVGLGADNDNLNVRLLTDIHFDYIHRTNAGALDVERIEFLRQNAEAKLKLIDGGELSDIEAKLHTDNLLIMNQLIKDIQRGKAPNMESAQYLASYKTRELTSILTDFGMDTSTMAEKDLYRATIVRSLVEGMAISDEDKINLTKLFMSNEGQNIHKLHESSAALTKLLEHAAYSNILDSQNKPTNMYESLEKLGQFLGREGVVDQGNLNLSRIAQLEFGSTVPVAEMRRQQADMIEQMLSQRTGSFDETGTKPSVVSSQISHMHGIEVAAAFAMPIMFALASGGLKTDERVYIAALDTIQSLVETADNPISFTSQYMTHNEIKTSEVKALSSTFRAMRIKQAIRAEGFRVGLIQGIGQELVMRGTSQLVRSATTAAINAAFKGAKNPITAALTIAGDMIGTTMSIGFSRAISRARGIPNGFTATDPISRMLQAYIEAMWISTEDALLGILNQDTEVIDSDYNDNLDFDITAIPSDIEWDLESGAVVLDASGDHIHSDVGDVDYSSLMTVSSLVE